MASESPHRGVRSLLLLRAVRSAASQLDGSPESSRKPASLRRSASHPSLGGSGESASVVSFDGSSLGRSLVDSKRLRKAYLAREARVKKKIYVRDLERKASALTRKVAEIEAASEALAKDAQFPPMSEAHACPLDGMPRWKLDEFDRIFESDKELIALEITHQIESQKKVFDDSLIAIRSALSTFKVR
jgi:hypothetical protein